MKTNVKLLVLGFFFLLFPHIIYGRFVDPGIIMALIATASTGIGIVLIFFQKREGYKLSDVEMGKVFEIKSIYAVWKTRVGISFANNEREQYFISPIPDELKEASCGEKFQKTKNGIIKI